MLGLLPHRCAHLAGVFDGEKIYLVSSIIMKIYPALSAASWGWHGMDGSRANWMTSSINRTHH